MLLVDTNVWLAAADEDSKHFEACSTLLRDRFGELASTVPTIAETSWMLLDRFGPTTQLGFLSTVATNAVTRIDLTDEDWRRVVELVGQYADLALDVVDASTIAVAERLGETTVATLDRRDFLVVRPQHAPTFDLLP